MAKRVRNRFGVISEVPDDYPEDLMRQLELEEVHEGEGTQEAEPQPQREGRRSRR
jgi:maltooligosyltrehalose synthase